MQFKLSPSSLSLMKECPRCFWLTQHKIWARPNGIFPSLPAGMDRVLKNHFDNFLGKDVLPPELENYDPEIRLFPNQDLLIKWRNNLKGIEWRDEEGNLLHGAVDNLLLKNNKIIVLDYKTRGFALKDNTHERYRNQLDIYNYLLRKNGYETEDFALLLFYVPSKVKESGEVVFDTIIKKMEVDILNAEILWKKALNILNNECPSMGCKWCERF